MTFIQKLNTLLSKRDKIILFFLLAATIIISILEVATISITMFFITLITDFNMISHNKYYLFAQNHLLNNLSPSKFLLIFGSMLIFFYLIRCFITFFYTYYLNKYAQTRYHIFAFRFFKNYLYFNYQQFTSKNSALINKLIFYDAGQLTTVLASTLTLLSEVFTVIFIYASLIFINWKMTLILTGLLTIKIFFLIKTFSKKLSLEGEKAGRLNSQLNKIFRESFGNFKLIKLLSNENYLLNQFNSANYQLAKANTINATLQNTPRLFLETIGFIVLVGTVMSVVYKIQTPQYVIPLLSMYALAFYRFMPSVTRILTNYNQILFSKSTIDKSNPLFYSSEELGIESVSFKKTISFCNISFGYLPQNNILSKVNFTINYGETIAFIGESGAGKSTLIDILMGLYIPQEGIIYVDNKQLSSKNLRSWRNKIGYIPQNIYLFDGTITENVIFGRPYNKQQLISVLQQANIYDFLLTQNGLDTKVGEEGILLSGGQKQRIAIARALYSNPEILILDEATSALDHETESKIMNEIYALNKNKTLIIIAHRLSTILRCKKIYRIKNQEVYLENKNSLYQQAKQSTTLITPNSNRNPLI